MKLNLSPRLQRIADYVRPGDTVIDVGTDHGYIPIWLLQNGISARAVATDLKSGPLANAAKDAEKHGVSERLTLLLCDGLATCTPDMGNTIIIAGMGGETIMGILAAAQWSIQKRLIFQPQTKLPELREWLRTHGYAIRDAALSYDAGRIYLVWLVEAGEMAKCPTVDPPLLEKRDPLLRPYAEDHIKHLRKQIQGMSGSARVEQSQVDALKAELNDYLDILKEAENWQI